MEVRAMTGTSSRWNIQDITTPEDIRVIELRAYNEAVPFTSTIDLLRHAAACAPNEPALLFQTTADLNSAVLPWTYADLLDQVVRAANLLRQCGVQRNDPVAILAPNMPSTHIALWAAQLAGCAFPINYLLGAEHVAKLLEAGRVKAVITLAESKDLKIRSSVMAAVKLANLHCPILEIDPDESSPFSGSFQSQLRRADPIDQLSQTLTPSDTAAIFHTGGTTGLPKILRQTHANELHTSCMAAPYYHFHKGDILLNGFPLFHVAGAFVYGLAALAVQGTVYIPTMLGMRNRDFIHSAWALFRKHRVSHLGCVPTTLASLTQSYEENNIKGTCGVRIALTGGSALPVEIAAHFEQRTQVPVRNIFGMTECAGIVSIEPDGMPRTPGSAGLALPYTKVRAVPLSESVKPVIENFCETGEEGVLCVRGPHISPGYIDESRNAGTFSKNGWLVSGDLGYVDAEGRIYITGRSKDLIIRSGHNIDPQAIEEAFLANPDVLDCAAVGEPDEYAGELPVVFITLKPGANTSAEELLADAHARISEPPAMPKKAYILSTMPTTPVGKIFKPDLRRMAIAEKIQGIAAALNAPGTCMVTFPDKHAMHCVISIKDTPQRHGIQQALRKLPIDASIKDEAA
ncbi:MAG: hypothetical protein EPN76_10850 [Burkholderiaceae bacterium]|nr:MAG: hypothetical protein EPN76_10850 [Burkholderiaceae bacterium]TAM02711.1 MAG: hypothetical protein EPN67_10650 [Pusillimonas sp.]